MRAHIRRRVALGIVLGMAAMTANLAEATTVATTYDYAEPSTSTVRDTTLQGSASATAKVSGSDTFIYGSDGSFTVSGSVDSFDALYLAALPRSSKAYAQIYFQHNFYVTSTSSTSYSVTSLLNFTSASGSTTAAPPRDESCFVVPGEWDGPPDGLGYCPYYSSVSNYSANTYMDVHFIGDDGSVTPASHTRADIPPGENTSLTLTAGVAAGQPGIIVIEVYVTVSADAQGTASASVQAAGTLASITITP